MSEHTLGKKPLHERALSEFKEMAALAAYLYVCLGAIVLFKASVLRGAGISFTIWGIALLKALILAKFMLVGRMLHFGEGYGDKPLIWPTLYRSLMFLLLLLVLTTIEELLVGLIDGRSWADSLSQVVGPNFYEGLATSFIMFLILVPYSAFTCLGDLLGEREVFRLFFVSRSIDAPVSNGLVTDDSRPVLGR